jgi:hypothetical protein
MLFELDKEAKIVLHKLDSEVSKEGITSMQ